MEQSSLPSSCFFELRTRGRSTSRTTALLSKASTSTGKKATEAGTSAWADFWRDVWHEIDAWGGLGDSLSVRKVKAHTNPEAVMAGVISADDRAGNDLAAEACKLVALKHRAPPSIRAARRSDNLAVTRMAHWIARIGSARQRRDIDEIWIPGRGRPTAVRRERGRPWPLPLPALPTIRRRGHTFVGSALARLHGRNKSGLTALRGTESLISCREARWSQCSAPCVVRAVVVSCENLCSATALVHRLLEDCWLCATCCWVSCLRTVQLDCVPGEVLRAQSGSCRTRGPFLTRFAQLPFRPGPAQARPLRQCRILEITDVHQCGKLDFLFVSLCFQDNLLLVFFSPALLGFQLFSFFVHCCFRFQYFHCLRHRIKLVHKIVRVQ